MLHAILLAVSSAVPCTEVPREVACHDFGNHRIPCDELQRAHSLNTWLSQGTTGIGSRGYDWVHGLLDRELLPDCRWKVGHMCPNDPGSLTSDVGASLKDKARNLLAQTSADHARLGQQPMSIGEATFYGRDHMSCDEIFGKGEL